MPVCSGLAVLTQKRPLAIFKGSGCANPKHARNSTTYVLASTKNPDLAVDHLIIILYVRSLLMVDDGDACSSLLFSLLAVQVIIVSW